MGRGADLEALLAKAFGVLSRPGRRVLLGQKQWFLAKVLVWGKGGRGQALSRLA